MSPLRLYFFISNHSSTRLSAQELSVGRFKSYETVTLKRKNNSMSLIHMKKTNTSITQTNYITQMSSCDFLVSTRFEVKLFTMWHMNVNANTLPVKIVCIDKDCILLQRK